MPSRIFLVTIYLLVASTSWAQLWKQYADSAKIFRDQKKNQEALDYYILAKELHGRDSMVSPSYAQICSLIGGIYYQSQEYSAAEQAWLESKQIREKTQGRENREYALVCHNLGNVYLVTKLYDKSEPLFVEAKQLREKIIGRESNEYIATCNNLGLLYHYTRQYEKAEQLFIESKDLREKLSGREDAPYLNSLNNLANLYIDMGEVRKAEQQFLEILSIREPLGKSDPFYAKTCDNLAGFYHRVGEYNKAEERYLELKGIVEQSDGKNNLDYPVVCTGLGLLYQDMGRYSDAELFHLEALRIRETLAGKENEEYALSCNNLAGLYTLIGQYASAENLLIEAMQVVEKLYGKESELYAAACSNLGATYQYMKDYGKAEKLYKEAMAMQKKVSAELDYSQTCSNLASLYGTQMEGNKAIPLFLEAMEIQERLTGKNNRAYANSLDGLASVYSDLGNNKEAEKIYLLCKSVRKNFLGPNHPDFGWSCTNLAYHYWANNRPGDAEKEFKEGFLVNKFNLASLVQFTNEKEQTTFVNNVLTEMDRVHSFYMSNKLPSGHPYDVALSRRNLVLSSAENLNRKLNKSNNPELIEKFSEWKEIKRKLSALYTSPLPEKKNEVFKLEEKAGQLEKQLTRLSSVYKTNRAGEINWKTIQSSLGQGEAALEFLEFQYYDGKKYLDSTFYTALLLKHGQEIPELIFLFEKKSLYDAIRFSSGGEKQVNFIYSYQKTGNKNSLYELIWKPIEGKLSGIKKVYFAPAGELQKVSFSALPINDKEVLGDIINLVQLQSTASISDSLETKVYPNENIYLFGGIKYDADSISIRNAVSKIADNDVAKRSIPQDLLRNNIGEFMYLAGTEKEVRQIEQLATKNGFSTTVVSGLTASEESFKKLNGSNSPSIIHIATHGFFFPDTKRNKKSDDIRGTETFRESDNPMIRSGLALAGANNRWKGKPVSGVEDGILTAYEISNMYLPNTKLAVLSACETGLGDVHGSEGVYGLQRACKIAGIESLLMSLWKVPDGETAEFMQEFYKNIFLKQDISTSFYKAQTTLKNKYRQEPFKWAAWILVR